MRKKDKIPELEDTALLPDAMPASSLPSGSVNGWQVAGARVVTTKLHGSVRVGVQRPAVSWGHKLFASQRAY